MEIKEWLLPIQENLDVIVDKVIESDKRIKDILGGDNTEEIKHQFEGYIADSYNENRFMRNFATVIDVWDKALVPVDIVGDYMKIMGEAGYGISAGKELAEMVIKLPYMAYYTAKTGKIGTTALNLCYEALSWLIPGSILDLSNRYTRQADEYIIERAKDKFLKEIDEPS